MSAKLAIIIDEHQTQFAKNLKHYHVDIYYIMFDAIIA